MWCEKSVDNTARETSATLAAVQYLNWPLLGSTSHG